MFKPITLGIAITTLVGCANSQQYAQYLNTQTQIELAHANAEAERYRAMAEIAKFGDTTTQVAAMMSMQAQGTNGNGLRRPNIQAPKSPSEEIRAWAGILVPSLTQIGINAQNVSAQKHSSNNNALIATTNSANAMATAIAQSDNNAAIEINQAEQATIMSSNQADAFVSIAGEIQAPAANYNYTDSNNTYADSYNTPTDSYNTPTDSNNAYTDSYNDQSDNSDNSDNSVTNPVTP